MRSRQRRVAAIGASGLCLALAVTSCGAPENKDSGLSDEEKKCETYAEFGDFKDSSPTVSIFTPIADAEGDSFEASWEYFSECTGIQIEYEGSNDFEAQIDVRVEGGNAPDIAFFPQPGLMERYKEKMIPASEEVVSRAEAGWNADWLSYGTFDEKLYATPMSANLKSLVWYSPAYFEENKLEIPETWDDLIALSDKIAGNGIKPWCAGISSGEATGWPLTDWVEDMILRESGGEVFDQWVNHEIPFDDPQIVAALDKAGEILKNDDYVNGGLGDVKSIADTTFEDAGLPILDGECAMHRQATFYSAYWGDTATIAPDGDIFAFLLPGNTAEDKPVLGGGEFVAAFREADEVESVRQFLSTGLFANARMKTGPWASANLEADPATADNELMKLAVETFQAEGAEFRFDGSDLMPGKVGSDAFFDEMTDWIKGKSSKDALAAVEAAWD